jgi:hypothetical protein
LNEWPYSETEQATLDRLGQAGQRTQFVETFYFLHLGLDKETAPIPVKRISWGRFESGLRERNLELTAVYSSCFP